MPVTYPAQRGVLLTDPPFAGQRAYPHAELGPRLLAAALLAEDRPASDAELVLQETRTAMFFGFDNAFERLFTIPAMLSAWPQAPWPAASIANHFYLLSGEKFSTSRGHLVAGRDFVGRLGRDAARYLLCATRPEAGQTDMRATEDPELDLVARAQAWLPSLRAVATRGSAVAAATTIPEARTVRDAYALERFSPRAAAEGLRLLLARAERETAAAAASGSAADAATAVAVAHAFGLVCAPITPGLSEQVLQALGDPRPALEQGWAERDGAPLAVHGGA
jgi:methionyl-tRNA synthetase